MLVSKVKTKRLEQLSVSLILVNVSLLSQWIAELQRTTLRHMAIYAKSDIEGIDMSKYDVILVAHNVYNLFCQVYRNKCWKRFIVDEPASLRIVAMEECTAKFYWLVTATPYELYPRKRSGFVNDLLPEFEWLKYIILKNDDHYVKISYDMPVTNHIYYTISCDMSKLFDGLVNQNTLEMLQAGNMLGVLASLSNAKRNGSKNFQPMKKTSTKSNWSKIILHYLTNASDATSLKIPVSFVQSHMPSLKICTFLRVVKPSIVDATTSLHLAWQRLSVLSVNPQIHIRCHL